MNADHDFRVCVHEAGHLAILCLYPRLAEVVEPSGVIVKVPVAGQDTQGGCVFSSAIPPTVLNPNAPPNARAWILEEAPDQITPALLMLMAGYAAEVELLGLPCPCELTWRATVNLSCDGRDTTALLAAAYGNDPTWEASYFIRSAKDAIFESARTIFKTRHDVRAGVLALAERIRFARWLTWRSANETLSRFITPSASDRAEDPVNQSSNSPLAGVALGAIGDAAQVLDAESNPRENDQKKGTMNNARE